MTAYISTYRAPGSVISGTPLWLSYYDQYSKDFDTKVIDIVKKTVSNYQKMAVEEISSMDEWKDLADSVSFTVGDSCITFSGPENLEYGTGVLRPAAILRKYAVIAEKDIPEQIRKKTRR